MQTRSISGPETSKMLKQALKKAFPTVTFSVRYKSYSGGSSISVHYVDGPTTKQVDAICGQFERCGFDSMQDMKTYLPPCELNGELVSFGADYISCSRSESFELLKKAAFDVAFECDLPLLEIQHRTESVYSSPSVKGGQNQVPWTYRIGFSSEDQNCFAYDPSGYGRVMSHAELIYTYARSIDCCADSKTVELPNRVTQDFVDCKVESMIA